MKVSVLTQLKWLYKHFLASLMGCLPFHIFSLTIYLSFKIERQYCAKLSTFSVSPSEKYMTLIMRFSSSLSWIFFGLLLGYTCGRFVLDFLFVLFFFFFLLLFFHSPNTPFRDFHLKMKSGTVTSPSLSIPHKGYHLSPAESPAQSGLSHIRDHGA